MIRKKKPKDEKKKKNKYIVKDGDGNIMDVEVPRIMDKDSGSNE